MKKLFENTTTYTLEEYKKFVRFHNKKYNSKYNFYTLLILFLIIFCAVSQISYGNITLGIVFILVAIIFILYRFFYPYLFVKKEAKSDKVQKQLTNTYTFYDKYMQIKNNKQNIKLKYYKLYKVFQTTENFYLYLNKNYSFVLSKNNFSIGNANDFHKFIKKKLWFRF